MKPFRNFSLDEIMKSYEVCPEPFDEEVLIKRLSEDRQKLIKLINNLFDASGLGSPDMRQKFNRDERIKVRTYELAKLFEVIHDG